MCSLGDIAGTVAVISASMVLLAFAWTTIHE